MSATAAAVDLAMQTVVAHFGGLDVLVNNAGVGVGEPISELSYDEWNRIIDTNLTGVFYCCSAAIPHLVHARRRLDHQHQQPGGQEPLRRRRRLLRVEGRPQCVQRGADAGAAAQTTSASATCMPGSVATGFSGREASDGDDWKLSPDDVAQVIVDLLDHPTRSLPSRVEIRPSRPAK